MRHNGPAVWGVGAESRWRVFCTRGAVQGYEVILFILALAKTVVPGGSPRRKPGQTVAPVTKRSSLVAQLSRHGAAIAYTGLLAPVNYFFNTLVFVSFLEL